MASKLSKFSYAFSLSVYILQDLRLALKFCLSKYRVLYSSKNFIKILYYTVFQQLLISSLLTLQLMHTNITEALLSGEILSANGFMLKREESK